MSYHLQDQPGLADAFRHIAYEQLDDVWATPASVARPEGRKRAGLLLGRPAEGQHHDD
ncbi:MAG: hypothetical protein KDE59_21430 [Anaerolineales bacterium]|nr:hypothetical protein [Anaerolineales bacterium]MCB0032198.1 hypothetical protein [Anaerolineales bacterium]